jgi:mannitol/fructose-specific phosphotransferase system IIA component (Ntr-type)
MVPLSDIFGEERIKLELEGRNKTEVFEELMETAAGLYSEYDRGEMLRAVVLREEQMSTVVLPGIAVPHGYSSVVGNTIAFMGFSRQGIEYGGPEPVHSVFMLLMDNSFRERHLEVLNRLLNMLNSEKFALIRAAGNCREICGILRHF